MKKMLNKWSWLHAIVIMAIALGCSNNDFNGGAVGADPVLPNQPFVPNQPMPACNQGIANVQLLNQSLNGTPSGNGMFRPQSTVRYSIKLNCDGQRVPLNNVPIAFDVNATVTPFSAPVGYRILHPQTGQPLGVSTMNSVPNADLFGQTGPEFAHWVTSPIQVSQAQYEVILEIVINDRDVGFVRDERGNLIYPINQTGQIETYCKVGPAQAVTRPVFLGSPY